MPSYTSVRHRKPTSQLTHEQAQRIHLAFNRARQLQVPLNCHVTIHWAFAPGTAHPVDRWQRLYEAARRWLTARCVPFTWAYVWERGIGGQQHLHLAVHVPKAYVDAFKAKVHDWVKASTDAGDYSERAVRVEPQRTPSMTGLVRYLVKGASAETRAAYGVREDLSAHQGVVEGKRADVSRNLRDISWPDEGDGPAPRVAAMAA